MKTRTCLTVAAIAFLSSLSVAIASGGTKEITAKSSSTSMSKDKLSLSNNQETIAWKDITKQARKERVPASFSTKVGAVVPKDLMTYPVPITTSSKVPALRRYQYALLENNKLVIVNPRDDKVADVIAH